MFTNTLWNQAKTAMLLTLLTALMIGFGGMVAGQGGIIFAAIFALALNGATYWFSDRIVLSLYGGKEASQDKYPQLYRIVEELAQSAGIPMPRICIINLSSPNAFATGRNPAHAVVAVTKSIMDLLDERELRAVIAHEMGHIGNRDILISTVAATIALTISMLASIGRWSIIFGRSSRKGGFAQLIGLLLLCMTAPLIAALIQMAISRSREFMADAQGAKITNDPGALADALEKLDAMIRKSPLKLDTRGTATSALFIANPFTMDGLMRMLSTHPPISERVACLRKMAK